VTEGLWILIALPLGGAAVLIVFGKRLGEPWSGWVASGLVGAGFVIACTLAVPFPTSRMF
jgi:NADH:ubiquinone oxidoreductase subunit 5 (subunit L)/multisubunit Na+/H+ antiporter MnhA subunit